MKKKQRIKTALEFIAQFGDCDGGHHKQWALDQIVRILTDCRPVNRQTINYAGKPYIDTRLGESKAYAAWLRSLKAGEDGPETYGWDEGTPP